MTAPSQSPFFRRRDWLLTLVVTAVPVLFLPWVAHDTFSPGGSGQSEFLKYLLLLPALLLVPLLLIVAAINACFARTRRAASRLALIAGALLLATIVGVSIASEIRDTELRRFAIEAEPLVVAIRSYSERHGTPPPSLDALAACRALPKLCYNHIR